MAKTNIQTIEEYIAQFPDEVQRKLHALRKLMSQTAPAATEKFAWGLPTYYQKGLLAEFGVYRNYIEFYTTPSTLAQFKKEPGNHRFNGKNMIQFPVEEDLPVDMIERIIRCRLRENGG